MRLEDLLAATGGVIVLREHPSRARTVQRAAAVGRLASPLPGVFVPSAVSACPWTRLLAVMRWADDAVVVGATAWALHQGREPTPPFLVAVRRRPRSCPSWLKVTARQVPAHHIVLYRGIRVADAAYVCAELAATDQGEAAFEALRQRLVAAPSLIEATSCFRGGRGQRERQRVIREAASNPWSFAEARLHALLRAAGIDGWVANRPVKFRGQTFYPDLRFLHKPLIIEIDGEAYHSGHVEFERDRERQNQFMLAGYRVLRFTWEVINERPAEVIAMIRAMLALL
ncbi:MAG: DUF559 domain-containing protein [Propionicimonas sp.]|nr:DUF559 domain-containing protein [Propionicimonas sp.]